MESLELIGVNKKFITNGKEKIILNDLNYIFESKTLYAIEGKSGSGKTTLLKIMLGLEKIKEGKVLIENKDISKMSDKEILKFRRYVFSMIYQNYSLIKPFSPLDNLCLPIFIRDPKINKGEVNKKAKEILHRYAPDIDVNKPCNCLSGGQQQRVSILRSVMANTSIILADEPTGALDAESSILIMELLKDLAKEKLVIVVTHNIELATKYADKILLLDDGRLYERN